MLLNEKIAIIRKMNNMSQEAFAEELGVSRQAVSKWETGVSHS
jgi:DNA-binding transcriptional regulator YiaG